MINEALTIAGAFDWITPTIAFIQDILYGPVSDFGIPASSRWRRGDIKRLLKKERIQVWGLMLNLSGEMLMFTVSKDQAQRVYNLLQQEGVPLLYAPAEVTRSSLLQPYNPSIS